MKNIKKEFPRRCEQCIVSIEGKRSDARFCSSACRSKNYRQRLKKWKSAIGQVFSVRGGKTNKIEHHRLTFILAVVSFLASLGFYFGVLTQIYSPNKERQQIEQLTTENQELKGQLKVLIEQLEENE